MAEQKLTKRSFLKKTFAYACACAGGGALSLSSKTQAARAQIGRCKHRGCRCTSFRGGLYGPCQTPNCGHLASEHA
jgi:hypothetical protein